METHCLDSQTLGLRFKVSKPKFLPLVAALSLGITGNLMAENTTNNTNTPPPAQLVDLQNKILSNIASSNNADNNLNNTSNDLNNANNNSKRDILNALSELKVSKATNTPQASNTSTPQASSTPSSNASSYSANPTLLASAPSVSSNAPQVRAVGGDWNNTTTLIYNTQTNTISGSGGTFNGANKNQKISSNGSNKDLTIDNSVEAMAGQGSILEIKKDDSTPQPSDPYSHITNFTNNGKLNAKTNTSAAWVQVDSSVTNFTNNGKIQGIEVGGTITNLKVENGGEISHDNRAPIYVRQGKIENLTIKGAVVSNSTYAINTNDGTSSIGNIEIDGGKVVSKQLPNSNAGVIHLTRNSTQSITVKNGGVVGVLASSSSASSISTVTKNDINKDAGKGIVIGNQVTGDITITGNGSFVSGIENGTSSGNRPGSIGGIQVTGGAELGKIDNKNNSTIAGNITVDSSSTLDKITNSGTIGGSISNSGNGNNTITNSGTIGGSISNSGNGNNTITTDKGSTIEGGIQYGGSGNLTIDSNGKILGNGGNHIENTGSGNIKVSNIVVDTNNLHQIGGSGSNHITFDKVTIDTNVSIPENVYQIFGGSAKADNFYNNGTTFVDLNGITDFSVLDPITGNFSRSALNLDKLNVTSGAKYLIIGNQRISRFASDVATITLMNLQNAFNHSTTFYDETSRDNLYYASALGVVGTDIIQQDSSITDDSLYFKDHVIYVLPYYSSQEVKADNSKVIGNVQGIVAGLAKITPFNNLYSFYVGFDGEDADSEGSPVQTNVVSKTLYGGFKMLHYLKTLSNFEVYAQYDASAGLRRNRLTSVTAAGTSDAVHPKSWFYNAGADLGVNYLWGKNIFTPKIGLGYEGGAIESYGFEGILANTRIHKQDLNFFHTRASLLWSRAWNSKLHTYVEGGLKYIFNPELTLNGSYALGGGRGRQSVSKDMDLDELNEFINIGIYVPLSNVLTFDVVYSGNFSDNYTGHIGYLKFNYLF